MCGILGVLRFDQKPVCAHSLKTALDWMQHRGPDDEGVWTNGCIGLAHRRLSILDLSSAGHQPMATSDDSAVIVYNGECYNFQDLKNDLESQGHCFRSRCDTEVVACGLRAYGVEFVKRMNGMFALGIWFKDKKELLLIRDRLGIKPLYIYHDREQFLFSSEIKPLLSLGVQPQLEESMVSSFFSLRYCPGEKTLFKNITKLPSGSFCRIRQDGTIQIKDYWNLEQCKDLLLISEKNAQDRFFEILDSAVAFRQVADVPVGAFLSGGVDSSAIVALMKKNTPQIKTFTMSLGADIDESARAKQIADFIGVENETVVLKKNDFELYSKALWHLEEPLGDSIIVPTYLLARAAAQKLKVVQLGEGADEILGGYVHQLAMTYGDAAGKIFSPGTLRKLFSMGQFLPQKVFDKIFPYPAKMGQSGRQRILDYLSHMKNPAQAYFSLAGVFDEDAKKDLFNKSFYENAILSLGAWQVFEDYFSRLSNPVFQNRLLQLDLKFWNTDYTMLRMDKLTMAHSLEARVPYLDYRLVEFCLGLPRWMKTKRFKQKLLLRGALKGRNLLEDDVINAPKKAFFLPIEKCFDYQFETYLKDILSSSRLRQRKIFNPHAIDKIINSPSRDLLFTKQVMLLLSFELWARLFLDGEWMQT